ncbi:hypothetical protein DPEC_G00185700 [Dallia pectoralis]|uniref:Uncharacterized protein n=1 Tax=Dallia pectoralis TaxID=75939 RepID=A0ACC2GBP5_DALPE|nr:hypothetical protein DPEC_G00185700 [Dallia pectoralis]
MLCRPAGGEAQSLELHWSQREADKDLLKASLCVSSAPPPTTTDIWACAQYESRRQAFHGSNTNDGNERGRGEEATEGDEDGDCAGVKDSSHTQILDGLHETASVQG